MTPDRRILLVLMAEMASGYACGRWMPLPPWAIGTFAVLCALTLAFAPRLRRLAERTALPAVPELPAAENRGLDTVVPAAERAAMLRRMRAVTLAFYAEARRIGAHSFIEWTGVLDIYVDLCEAAQQQGIDFTQGGHAGGVVPLRTDKARYLGEKLHCLLGRSLAADPASAAVFLRMLMGKDML